MWFAIFLLPLVASVPLTPNPDKYILDVEDGVLKNVRYNGENPLELDLSNMQLHAIEKNALDNVPTLKSLNLANNSLESLPEFVFSNLTNLEYLSIAGNKIDKLEHLFIGLDKLRTLNISRTSVAHLRRGQLFGLTKSATIYTDDNIVWSISTGAFSNAFLKDEVQPMTMEQMKTELDATAMNMMMTEKQLDRMELGMEMAMKLEDAKTSSRELKADQKLKLCMSDKIVVSLEPYQDDPLPEGCSKLSVEKSMKKVSLAGLGIKGFQEGWYKLESLPIVSLDLSNNDITEITKEILNDLPEGLTYVNFLSNRIRKIWNDVIANPYLRMLNFKLNLIDDVEEGALQKTNLTGLFLTDNQLENLNFVTSLPQTLTEFVLVGNRIATIPDKCFTTLSNLKYLNLGNNKIVRLQNNVFKGLSSLQVLVVTRNNLTAIEPKAFKDLKQLTTLYLYRNSLAELGKGVFADLENLRDLNLAYNKFAKITKNTFASLPNALNSLHLDDNEIDSLEEGSFVDVPLLSLSLNGNQISSVARGTFNLPSIRELYLSKNLLTVVDGDSFEGMPRLNHLSLSENRISEIPKGFCKNLYGLNILDISRNPFQKLQNGALYGLSTARGNFVYVYENQLKELQGGVFDDV